MNLAEWAEAQHIHPQTAYRWFRAGKLPVPAERVGGLILVGDLTDTHPQSSATTAIYPRVSSADQKSDLDRQVARVTAWARSNGYSVDSVVTEVGSAQRQGRQVLGAPPGPSGDHDHR
jgi:putative resolvase